MVHTFTTKGPKQYRYYACLNALKNGYDSCPARALPAAEIERVVVEQVRDIAQDPALLAEVLTQARAELAAELAALEVQMKDLTRQLARQHAEIGKLAATTGPLATALIAELSAQVGAGQRQMADLETQVTERTNRQATEAEVAGAFGNFNTLWNTLSPREQAQVLGLLIARAEFDAQASTVAVEFHAAGIQSLGQKMEVAA